MTLHRTSGYRKWINGSSCYCLSVCSADREWEAVLEASAGGSDRERPPAVWQSTTRQGGLAEPCTHLSTFSNTVRPTSYIQTSRHTQRIDFMETTVLGNSMYFDIKTNTQSIVIKKTDIAFSLFAADMTCARLFGLVNTFFCSLITSYNITFLWDVLSKQDIFLIIIIKMWSFYIVHDSIWVSVFIQSGPLWSWPGVPSLWHGAVLCHSDWHTTRHRDSPVPGRDHQGSVPVDQTHSQWMSRLSWNDQRSHYEWVPMHNTWKDSDSVTQAPLKWVKTCRNTHTNQPETGTHTQTCSCG